MTRRSWIRWGIVAAIGVALAGAYAGMPALRGAVNRTVLRLFTGSTGDTRTFWCPMDPEVVRKGPGMCPV